jgi:PAS domain S-box-containing protein
VIGATNILKDISNPRETEEKIKLLNEELEFKVNERTFQLQKSLKLLGESEEKFQKAFQASAAGIAITKVSDSRFTDVNDAFVRITGFNKDEIIGRTSLEIGYIINAPKREEILKQIREKGRSQYFENTIRSKSGELKEVLSSAETITIEGERFVISVIFDITDRKRAEEDLAKSDALFTSLFELNPAAIAISNISSKKIISINSAFLNLVEFDSKEEIIGKTAIELSILNSPKNREEVISQLKEGVKTVNIEGEVRTKKGNVKWISTSIIQIEINNEPSLLAVIQDITKRKQAEEQLQNINHELEAFSYSVSHDLRAPLRAINGYSRMLHDEYVNSLDDEGKRILNIISSNAVKMGVLIDELLDFSRLGRKELKKSSVDMSQLAANISTEIKRNLKHHCQIKINELPNIMGDSGLLHQIMFNLISNAIKYSSTIETPQIEISSIEKNGEVIFSISDNGVGFDMVYAEKLFGVFQRLHSQEEFEGVGVGLAIVKRIITKHGGKVWAYGEVNKGATFYFSIPK